VAGLSVLPPRDSRRWSSAAVSQKQFGMPNSGARLSLRTARSRQPRVPRVLPPQTFRAASAFIAAMPSPTTRSGQAERVYAVANPAAMIATFAAVSLRAERNARQSDFWTGEVRAAAATWRRREPSDGAWSASFEAGESVGRVGMKPTTRRPKRGFIIAQAYVPARFLTSSV
jgi:hypothetical protein